MEKHGKNPFLVNTSQVRLKAVQCFSSSRFISTDNIKVDEDGDALPKIADSFEGVDMRNTFLVDKAKSCKVYQSDNTFTVLSKLDGNGKTMFLYVQQIIKKDSDVVELEPETYKTFADVTSTKTFYNAVAQLLDNGILAKNKTHKYWVNPFFVFNGNRLEKYPDNVDIIAKVQLK